MVPQLLEVLQYVSVQSFNEAYDARSARDGRNEGADRLDRSGRRDGQGRQRRAGRQGIHRRGLRHRDGARRRRRGQGRDRRRRRGRAARRRAGLGARDSAAARRSRKDPPEARRTPRRRNPSVGHAWRQPTAPTDRDLASIGEARTLARRAKEAAPALAEFSQEQIDAIVDAMAAAVTPQAEALARLAHEETGYGVVADKVQKNLFASEKIYNFIRPMKTVGVIAPARGSQGHRDRRAVRRRRGDRPVDQPDLHRDLQDPDRAQGALPDRHQPAPVGRRAASRGSPRS